VGDDLRMSDAAQNLGCGLSNRMLSMFSKETHRIVRKSPNESSPNKKKLNRIEFGRPSRQKQNKNAVVFPKKFV
jgi:hypothetical protein